MSSALPWGRFSMMSTRTTSEWSRRATSCATVAPTAPAPMTVTLLRNGRAQLLDDRVGHLARPDGGGIVSGRLHVLGDALSLGDDLGDGSLEAVGRLHLVEVTEHEDAGEHHRHRVRLVLACVLGRRAMCGLEDRGLGAEVGARRDAEPADEARAEVGDDVPVQIREDEDVVLLRPLDELHAEVVDNSVLELDVGVLLGYLAGDVQPQPV